MEKKAGDGVGDGPPNDKELGASSTSTATQPPPSSSNSSISTLTHQRDITRATQNSLRDAVGAFPIAGPGGGGPSSASGNTNDNSNSNSNLNNNATSSTSHTLGNNTPPYYSHNYTNENLPPNIDIIAEATLVPNPDDRNENGSRGGRGDVVVEDGTSSGDDVDTLGLGWDDEAELGGAALDTVSIAVSAITTPYIPAPPPRPRRREGEERREADEESPEAVNAPPHDNTIENENQEQHSASHQGRETPVTATLTADVTTRSSNGAAPSNSSQNNGEGNNGPPPPTVTASSLGTITEAKPMDNMTVFVCGKTFRFEKWHLILLGMLVLIVIIVPTAVVVPRNKKEQEEELQQQEELLQQQQQQQQEQSLSWTREEIENIVSPSISLPTLLEVPTSSQSLAIDWLAHGGGTDVISGPNKESVEWRIQQRYILAVLYYTTNGETSWTNQYGFLDNDLHECDWGEMLNNGWNSLDCNDDMEVELINLWQNNLMGPIPSELASLTKVTAIDFSTNSLTGEIPIEIYNMMNSLNYLNLGYNMLTGTLASELGNLVKLTYLMVDHNDMTGTIPSELGKLTELSGWLSVEGNKLTGTVPESLAQLTKATWIYLHYNDLTGDINFMCDALKPIESPDGAYTNETSPLLKLWADTEEVNCTCCDCCPIVE